MIKIGRKARHSYHSDGTDLAVHRRQAEDYLKDRRNPQETVLHLHSYQSPCGGHEHECYYFDELQLYLLNSTEVEHDQWKDKS